MSTPMDHPNHEISSARRALRPVRPETPDELHGYIRAVLGFDVPRRARVRGMTGPFDYLSHSFFEVSEPRDCVVWANRGGGKTQLGAIATLLDLVFKPGVEIRILGGSLDQSTKMYGYLREMLERDELGDLIDGRATGRRIQLITGSCVEILAQSERSVRGQRVQKLRCDEVELFTADVWQAAQYVTRSAWCGDIYVRGAVEILSTMHRPFGIMSELTADPRARRQFRWSVIDTLETCPPSRRCEACSLWTECGGAARHGPGHFRIDDAIQQKSRSSTGAWNAEMLCERPSRADCVYPEFAVETHVRPFARCGGEGRWVGGMDFGIRSPAVFLWAHASPDGPLWIVDEHVARDLTLDHHIDVIRGRGHPSPAWIGVDPAGHQRNEHTGVSSVTRLRRAGFHVKARRVNVKDGVEAVRKFIRAADGSQRLLIDPRCTQLIEALQKYHYDADRPYAEEPVKDGPDHACDALRYLIVNYDRPPIATAMRSY